jgi:hypothetical protein
MDSKFDSQAGDDTNVKQYLLSADDLETRGGPAAQEQSSGGISIAKI